MDDTDVHMVETDSNNIKQVKKAVMDVAILDAFPKLTNKNDGVRLDGGMTLLKHLDRQPIQEENDNNEFKYTLSRLIRGLGSSKTFSKKGYYTTLSVFLIMHPEMPIQTILSTIDHELNPGDSSSKSENADIYMGRVLAYGALVRSKILAKTDSEIQLLVIQKLITAGKQRSYLSFVSTSFLIEYINQVEARIMKTTIWPAIEAEFGKTWSEQTLDTLYVLFVVQDKFPNVGHKFLKKYFGSESIITTETLEPIANVLTDLPRIMLCHHPVYKIFCNKLISTGLVSEFWVHIDKKLEKPSKTDECVTIELFKLVLQNVTDTSILPSLLSPHFVSHLLKKLPHFKKHHDNMEIMAEFRNSLQLLVATVSQKSVKTTVKLEVLKKLILYPGELMIEKKTGVKIIYKISDSLNMDGVKKLSKLLREIVENTLEKEQKTENADSNWTNAERTYAAQLLTRLMGHPETLSDHDWRLEQLKFLFKYGLCEIPNVGVELAPQLKENFYRALDHRLPKLDDVRNVLSTLVHYLDANLKSKNLILRNCLSEEAEKTWNNALKLIEKLERSGKKTAALPVFHTMNLHMCLQLYSDHELAIMSINELQCCYERLLKKSGKNRVNKNIDGDEPEWVEVVIDLILSLLSRNSHLLRSLVGCVFPHICPHLTASAIHQILAVFDTKSEKGPLVDKDSLSDDDEDNDEGEENESDDDESSSDSENNNENDQTDDSDSDVNEDSMDEDETVTDRLRQAVRQALGDAIVHTDDEDMDVDQINEEEGKRLDESLAAAFKILRENRQNRTKKQEKSAQTVMHFRLRVIDLLEMYLDNNPTMAITLDMIVPLFALLEYCIKEPHQLPLQHRVKSCLKKLSSVKKFKNVEGVDNELITVILKALIEKGERTTSICQEMSDKLAENATFLVRCAQQANVPPEDIVQIYNENLTAFFKKRDCVLPPILFKSIFQLHWEGNWKLAPLLVDFAFDSTIRSFRRAHALEFLTTFYNNGRLVQSDTEHISARAKLEKKLCKNTIQTFEELISVHEDNCEESKNTSSDIRKEVKQRYICVLLNLLRIVHSHRMPQWNWKQLTEILIKYRSQVTLAKDTKSAFNKLAAQLGVSVNPATKKNKIENATKTNGQAVDNDSKEFNSLLKNENEKDEHTDEESEDDNKIKKKKKNKNKSNKKQKLKKEARLLREKSMSDGFEAFQFSSFNLLGNPSDETIVHQNGDAQNESTAKSTKRSLKKTVDIDSKPKRKKSIQTA